MTQSDAKALREELLKQTKTGNQAVDAGLAHLRQLVEAEQARVRRLERWTRRVWIAIPALLVLCLVVPFVVFMAAEVKDQQSAVQARTSALQAQRAAEAAEKQQPATRPSQGKYVIIAQPAGGHWKTRFIESVLGPLAASMFLVGLPALLVLIVVGIVLLILTILARRTVGMHEIRASLASIDAQLRVLAVSDSAKSARPQG
jgi:predicted PurR-regulated permease PerM